MRTPTQLRTDYRLIMSTLSDDQLLVVLAEYQATPRERRNLAYGAASQAAIREAVRRGI